MRFTIKNILILQKLASEITDFITQNTEFELVENSDDFPKTPFDYLFLPEKNLVFHCITLDFMVDDVCFFQNLTNHYAQKNIKLVHIWEDIWQTKRAIVESRLLSNFGKTETIPARLTQVRRIDKKIMDKFLTDNHLQGAVNAKLKYGLFLPKRYFRILKDEQNASNSEELLVAVATFSNAKNIVREDKIFRSYELIRFANLKNFTVVGGLNKLLKNFIEEQNPDDIMTYSDSDWSDGMNYEKIGFERIEQTPPLIFELDSQTFRRSLVIENNDNFKVYNAGNWKFLMKLTDGK